MAQMPLGGQRIELSGGGVAWWPCHIGHDAVVGPESSIGALAHVGQRVQIGQRCKIQGSAYIADDCHLEDDVFVGPSAVLLNDRFPPSNDRGKWKPIHVASGAVIGGNATVIAGCNLGEGSVLAAGSVLTKHLPAKEVWAGNPARYLMSREAYDQAREDKV